MYDFREYFIFEHAELYLLIMIWYIVWDSEGRVDFFIFNIQSFGLTSFISGLLSIICIFLIIYLLDIIGLF